MPNLVCGGPWALSYVESPSRMHKAEFMMGLTKKRPHCKDQRNNDGSENVLATVNRLKQVGAENLRLYDFWISSLRVAKRTQRQWEVNFSLLVQKLFSNN